MDCKEETLGNFSALILKLFKGGCPIETICSSLGVPYKTVTEAVRSASSDGSDFLTFMNLAERASVKYRSAVTNQLMTDPVLASDSRLYEKSFIETWLLTSNTSPVDKRPLANLRLVEDNAIRDEGIAFCRDSIVQLKTYFICEIADERAANFAGECLAVLQLDELTIDFYKIIGAIGSSLVLKLCQTLKSNSSSSMRLNLIERLTEVEGCQTAVFFIALTSLSDAEGSAWDLNFHHLISTLKPEFLSPEIGVHVIEIAKKCNLINLIKLKKTLMELNMASWLYDEIFLVEANF